MKTVLITGCSTGFGRETALHFLTQGWRVIATMRDPQRNTLPESDRLIVKSLDVTDQTSIARAVADAGDIDVLVNNAGIGWLGPIEGTPMEMVRALFETNLFGPIAMMKAVIPAFRARGDGVIVNVSSSVTLADYPLLSAYRASKMALNSLTGTIAQELAPFGIRTRVVNPGRAPTTAFASNVGDIAAAVPPAYGPQLASIMQAFANQRDDEVTFPSDVAEAVYRAATDPHCPQEIAAGADALALLEG